MTHFSGAGAEHAEVTGMAGPVEVVDERTAIGPEHVVEIEGPDVSGHFEWRCVLGDAESSGLEPDEVLGEAELHGPIAANAAALDRVRDALIEGGYEVDAGE